MYMIRPTFLIKRWGILWLIILNHELPDVQADFRKDRVIRDQIANIRWIIEKTGEFQKGERWKVKVKSLNRVWLFATPRTVAHQASPSMEFSRQEYCSGLPFSSPGYLPNSEIKPRSRILQADTLPSEPPREFQINIYFCFINYAKALIVWITINCGKFWKRWEYQTTWPASWETYMQVRKQQLELDIEQQTGSK